MTVTTACSAPDDGNACIDGGSCEPASGHCPPEGPYGFDVGDTYSNLELENCDGKPVSLHDLCGAKVGMVTNLYSWCSSCVKLALFATSLQQSHGKAGLSTMVVITEDALAEPPTAKHCQDVRDHYELEGIVAYDPAGTLEANYGGVDLVMLSDSGANIIFKRDDATEQAIIDAIDAELAGD